MKTILSLVDIVLKSNDHVNTFNYKTNKYILVLFFKRVGLVFIPIFHYNNIGE